MGTMQLFNGRRGGAVPCKGQRLAMASRSSCLPRELREVLGRRRVMSINIVAHHPLAVRVIFRREA
jgi:hypothetical protein